MEASKAGLMAADVLAVQQRLGERRLVVACWAVKMAVVLICW